MEWYQGDKPSSVGLVTGMVAGLASVTPASGYIGPAGGLILGISSGIICEMMSKVVKTKLLIDDSIDVFAVHGVGGMIGSFAVSFLDHPYMQGLGLADDTVQYQVKVQTIAILSVSIYSVVGTLAILLVLDRVIPGGIRVKLADEKGGLDKMVLGEKAYAGLEEEDKGPPTA